MKRFILYFVCLWTVAGYSQQTLKRISETDSEFIVELFVFRNGTTNCSISGEDIFDWADGGWYYSFGTIENDVVTYYNHSPNNSLSQNNVNIPSIQLGSESYDFLTPALNKRFVSQDEGIVTYQGEDLIDYTPVLDITTECYSGGAFGTNTSFPNMFYGKLILQKAQNDGSPITNDLWIQFKTFDAYYNSVQVGETWYGKFDGVSWVEQTSDIFGNPVNSIESICSQLNSVEISAIDSTIIYPNPTSDVITIQNLGNINLEYDFEIIDYTGRVVALGKAMSGRKIDLSNLGPGYYIVKIGSGEQNSIFKILKK